MIKNTLALLLFVAPLFAFGAGSPVAGETLSVDLSGVCSRRGNDPFCAPPPAKVTSESAFNYLMNSILNKNIDGVQKALKDGALVNGSTVNGETPLMFAINSKNVEIVSLLIAAKANPNISYISNEISLTPVCSSAMAGQREIVELLISAGANLNTYSSFSVEGKSFQFSPIACSVLGENTDIIRKILQKGVLLNAEKTVKNVFPALNIAIAKNNLDAVSVLCAAKADANVIVNGKSPLRFAFEQRNLEVARVLLECSANPNWIDKNEISELRFLVKSNNSDGIRLIGKFKPKFEGVVDGKTLLGETVAGPELKIKTMRALLIAGASPKGDNLIGKMISPIFSQSYIDQSSQAMNIKLMHELVSRGANVDERFKGNSLVSYLINMRPNFYTENGIFEFFQSLVEASSLLGDADSEGNFPLVKLYNEMKNNPEKFIKIVDIFIAKGIDINAKQPSDGLTLLDYVGRNQSFILQKPLEQRGACKAGPKYNKEWKYCSN